ncbi:inositol monophosphatase family protein [Streptomyces sp. P9-2B-2]|uniref:inositol monophosphatase family protein n=1 Tax=Streptomyces TaxID=1883 RepID=UPI002252F24E|nr:MULTISPECIES: inositol monophosphatase family protein [Streptomyces]MCX4640468.1 inositol monophosphatase [Streptomyces platensis]WJY35896.1 inositol monophosphatase family protein [Streptomyces sp. P9-2B-2]
MSRAVRRTGVDRHHMAATEAAARAAAELLRRRTAPGDVRVKAGDGLVSEADTAAERAVLEVLRERTPECGVLAEEAGALPGPGPRWIVDPLDGTTNYLRGLPDYAVALALAEGDRLLLCVIHFPETGTVFTAVAGDGAYRDGVRMRPAGPSPGRPLVGTGFGTEGVVREEQCSVADRLLRAGFEIREPGSASTGLCRVACGAYDGYLEFGIGPWDAAPGALLVTEAGGTVSGWGGGPFAVDEGHLVAAAPAFHDSLVTAGGPCPPAVRRKETA